VRNDVNLTADRSVREARQKDPADKALAVMASIPDGEELEE
jgi:hypothetical protein